jgi:hypothetical protein
MNMTPSINSAQSLGTNLNKLVEPSNVRELRTAYVEALRVADDHDIEPLLAFARS